MKDNRGKSTFVLDKPSGFLRQGTIVSCDTSTLTVKVKFDTPSIGSDDRSIVNAQLPISFLSSGGGFIGGYVSPGTTVVVGQAQGSGDYFVVSFLGRDPSTRNKIGASKIQIPELKQGTITLQPDDNSFINLDSDGITIGEPQNLVSFDTYRNIYQNTFDYNYKLTQASREITGAIKRDRNPKLNYATSLREGDVSYDDNLKVIGMDPLAITRNSNIGNSIRNPARVEKHEILFEYEQQANVKSDDLEQKSYDENSKITINTNIVPRREGRADALSLSLVSPNYLMEQIKGTVVDVYGNILDINRNIIPIGRDNLSVSQIKSTLSESDTYKNIYQQIKRFERKSIAYHFEINARKETNGAGAPDFNNRDDYARQRSRFFFDIDKEGQFKLNVPASSETGNVPLLTRYENYSTVNPNSDSKDPNDLAFNENYIDVLNESFINYQPISIIDDQNNNSSPPDRFSSDNNVTYIKHGTAYHDISKTCITLQDAGFYSPPEYITTSNIASGRVTKITNIVSPKIITQGKTANAGGRSGQLNFDGSIEINIGANSVDRQSLWLDTQGGIISNVGRDLNNNISFAGKFDGHVLMEIGGSTVPPETKRFRDSDGNLINSDDTKSIAGTFDVRVYNSQGELAVLRIDNEGLTITTPGRVVMYSNGDMMLRSAGQMTLDAEKMVIQSRVVMKDPGKKAI